MGIISLDHIDNLFWLGRYTERVYTTLRQYYHSFDNMIDVTMDDYKNFCKSLDIPDIYGSAEDFKERYPFDLEDVNSIISNLTRAYDNGMIMRELIGSETLSYIQLALYDMQRAKVSHAPLIELQEVIDNILAFWGIADDSIDSEQVRNSIKAGKRVERIDLYGRLRAKPSEIVREVMRARPRLESSGIRYHKEYLDEIEELTKAETVDYRRIVSLVENLIITV